MNILKNATILIIDDDLYILQLLKELLTDKCKELILENNAESGLKLAREKQPHLVLLDILLRKVDGYEVCKQLKADPQIQHIPVIFLSALMGTADKVKGFEAGGVDYILKPFDIAEVIARIESCLLTHQKISSHLQTQQSAKDAEISQKYNFNRRELEILRLYISGYKRVEIATHICISENTVKWYLKQIFQKLEVNTRAALIEKISTLKL